MYADALRHTATRLVGHRRSAGPRALYLPSPLQVIALGVGMMVSLPLFYLGVRSLDAGAEGLDYLLRARTLGVVWNSVILTLAVMLSAALIGVPFAWLTARSNLPMRRVWLIAGLLPMVIPSYLGAVTYIDVFGPRGQLQQLLEPLGVGRLPSIFGFPGAWLAITLFTYPFVVLPVRAALMSMDPTLEESARSLGLSRWQVFRKVILPQLRPALGAGMMLTALYALSDFGAVTMMRHNVFTRAIYLQYTSSFDRNRAAILALVLVVLTLGLLALERRISSTMHTYRAGTGTPRPLRPVALGRWRVPALLFMGSLVGLGIVAPAAVLLSWFIGSLQSGAANVDLGAPLVNTIGASGTTAIVVGLISLPIAILAVRSSSGPNRTLVRLTYFGNVLPGLVVALALVFFATRFLPAWYQTFPILIMGYAVRFLPLSLGATRSALTQVNPRYEEAARGLGLRPWEVTLRITTPLARAGVLAGMALVFLSAMKELPTTLLLAPTGFNTFASRIWSAYESASLARIGAPSLLLVVISALSLALILRQERG